MTLRRLSIGFIALWSALGGSALGWAIHSYLFGRPFLVALAITVAAAALVWSQLQLLRYVDGVRQYHLWQGH